MGLHVVRTRDWSVAASYERSLRIVLVSDQREALSLPEQVAAAGALESPGDLEAVVKGVPPEGSDGMIVWFAGEKLREGSTAGVRRCLLGGRSRVFVPVHLPCMEELDLISLQPRFVREGAAADRVWDNIRIAGDPRPSPEVRAVLGRVREPWARLHLGLLAELESPGAGIEALEILSREIGWHPSLSSLVLRNLIVLMLRHDRTAAAESLLKKGLEKFPRYAELSYIAALIAAQKGSVHKVVADLRRATTDGDSRLIGSGGERFYRSHWLLGRTFAAGGAQLTVVHHYRSGLLARPAFEPSVIGLLRERLSHDAAYRLRLELCPLARRERRYLEPIFYFLLLHRQIESAARILEAVPMDDEGRARLRRAYEGVASAFTETRQTGERPGVLLTGPFFVTSSLARVNRQLAVLLLRTGGLQAALEPHGWARIPAERFPQGELIRLGLYRRPSHCDLTIRHHWPPNFRRPDCGKLACIVPWEFGALPVRWIEEIERNVAELWVPSEFVRSVFLRGGVAPHRIKVIPYGVDPAVYCPEGERWRPGGARGFVFLFVGGVIERKGVDVLAKAYRAAFGPQDDVTLVIKEQGSSTFYQNSPLLADVRAMARKKNGPRILVLTEELSDERLASLYRGADVFVLPYRGEGFGMPLAEALACGTPVITTGLGPAREFCPPDRSCFIDAQEVVMPSPPSYLGRLANDCTWFEPDGDHLARLMRRAFDHRGEIDRNSGTSSETILKNLAWDRVLAEFRGRVLSLIG